IPLRTMPRFAEKVQRVLDGDTTITGNLRPLGSAPPSQRPQPWKYDDGKDRDDYQQFFTILESGWPVLCMVGCKYAEYDSVTSLETEWRLAGTWPEPSQNAKGRPRILPLRPVLFPFALNTLVYGTFTWLMIFGPFVIRRSFRIKRGKCPRCAYILLGTKHDACPECGLRSSVSDPQ
ncbi:MAG: hypothetical protein O7G85_07065, partial [Planctomycetota bacterium]|nr:hypothetical protein [Planctomycetota bacterium]